MNILRLILAIAVLALSSISLLNGSSMNLTPVMLFLLGVLLLTMGAEEMKKEKKPVGYLLIVTAFFNFYVSIQGFLLG
ncbi:DUF3953 domain-containing protein [Virgibacillus xinjiangensis]|uniref:DUF3953 domain-containing protein n=1 Tax=Virgibacillus xinjiangensis TaxID=393090 RepID=A0ABV7CYB5_9BACI